MRNLTLKATDIFTATEATPLEGAPAWMNLDFAEIPGYSEDSVKGCGLYCIAFRGRAIYVGKFLGTTKKAAAGNVLRIRWLRHIASLTLRGRRCSFSKGILGKLLRDLSDARMRADLANGDSATLTKDRGYLASYNRAMFASDNWQILSAGASQVLAGFEFGYASLPADVIELLDIKKARRVVSDAEEHARRILSLCCNGESHYRQALQAPALDLVSVVAQLSQILADSLPHNARIGLAVHSPVLTAEPRLIPAKTLIRVSPRQKADESAIAMEIIEDELPQGWPTDLLNVLRSSGAARDLEVHATMAERRGDVRVRVLNLRRPQNIFTMGWRPTLSRFQCRIRLDPAQVTKCPGVSQVTSAGRDPLHTAFAFDANVDSRAAIDGLLRLIEEAANRRRGGA